MSWVGWIYLAAFSAYATLSPLAAWVLWNRDERAVAILVATLGAAAAYLAMFTAKAALA